MRKIGPARAYKADLSKREGKWQFLKKTFVIPDFCRNFVP